MKKFIFILTVFSVIGCSDDKGSGSNAPVQGPYGNCAVNPQLCQQGPYGNCAANPQYCQQGNFNGGYVMPQVCNGIYLNQYGMQVYCAPGYAGGNMCSGQVLMTQYGQQVYCQ